MHRLRVLPVPFSLRRRRHLIGERVGEATPGDPRAAQLGRSKGGHRLTLGSQPIVQHRPARPVSLPAPCPPTVAPYAGLTHPQRRAAGEPATPDTFVYRLPT